MTPSDYSAGTQHYDENLEKTSFYSINVDNTSASRWGNIVGGLTWIHTFNPRLQMNVSAGYSQYRYMQSQAENSHRLWSEQPNDSKTATPYQSLDVESHATYNSRISNVQAKADFTLNASESHSVRFGADVTWQRLSPTIEVYNHSLLVYSPKSNEPEVKESLKDETIGSPTAATTSSVYIEDDWTVCPWMKANIGLRYSLFSSEGYTSHSLEPRASVRFLPTDRISVKASYARMSQSLHMLTSGNLVMPSVDYTIKF